MSSWVWIFTLEYIIFISRRHLHDLRIFPEWIFKESHIEFVRTPPLSAFNEIKLSTYRIASNKRPTSRKRLPRINAPLFAHIIL